MNNRHEKHRKTGIALRIAVPILLSIALFISAIYLILLPMFENAVLEKRKEMVREMVHAACSLLATYNQQVESDELTLHEAQNRAIVRLKNMRYGSEGKDYFWINDRRPSMIMHPYRQDLEGADLSKYRDPSGTRLFIEAVKKVTEQGDGFIEYMWQWKDNPQMVVPKISYVRGFAPWGWIIGSGIYTDDVHAETRKITRNISIIALCIMGILFVFSGYSIAQGIKAERLQKKTEQSLRCSEEKYRELVESSNSIILRWKPSGKITYCNSFALRFFGFNGDELMGNNMLGTIARRDERSENIFKDFVVELTRKPEGFESHECENICKDGRTVWIAWTNRVLRNDDNDAVEILSIGNDVTRRKHAEDALLVSESSYREIFNAVNDAILVHDHETGRLLSVNPKVCELWGYSYDEIMQLDLDALSSGESPYTRTEAVLLIQKAAAGYPQLFEWCCKKKNGELFWMEVSLKLANIGGHTCVLSVERDITERKKYEEELLRLAAVIEQAAEIIVITDTTGVINYVNPSFCAVTGYARQEAIGQKPSILKSGQHDDSFYRDLWSTISRGKMWSGQFVNKKKDGTLYNEHAMINPVKNADGTVINYVAVKRDQTQEMKLEEQLRQAQKMESIGTLAGGIAHDFNNILSAIIGYTELCIDDVPDRPQTYRSLQQVLSAALRAKDLVSQILTFSRSKALDKAPIKIIPIVKEVCKFIRSSLPASIEIQQQITAEHDLILADPTQLHQILMNLCTNAGHAMKHGGGVLKMLLDDVVLYDDDLVHYPGLKTGSYLKLIVEDTGHGMSKEILDRIFEPYFTTKEQGEGTGLGLAVVHGIVKDYGGDIKVYSEIGKGTTFIILLPLIENMLDDQPLEMLTPPPTGTETILFIDDEKSLVDIGCRALEKLGYRVVGIDSVENAIAAFERDSSAYDLVITDKTMPLMNGYEVARKLRTIRRDVPVILCTGFVDKNDEKKIATDKINGFLLKPFNKQTIAQTVRSVLDDVSV